MLGVVLGQIQTKARNAGKIDAVSHLVERLESPLAHLSGSVSDAGSDFISGIFHAGSLKRQVKQLQNQLLVTADYSGQVDRLQAEIDNLRNLQGFGALPGHAAVPAQVTGIFTYDSRISIDAGITTGIKPGMAVVSGAGLLGIVQSVGSDESQVLLLTSSKTKIGAVALRKPQPAGLLKGESASTLMVEFLDPKSPAEVGDEVVTSPFSERIPPGIRIGSISRIENNEDFGTPKSDRTPLGEHWKRSRGLRSQVKGWRGFVAGVALLYIAGALQAAAPRMAILGATPDFLLLILAVLGMHLNIVGGMFLGFFDGLILGALSGANIQYYIATRTVTGVILGWIQKIEFQSTVLTAALITVGVTLFAQLLLMFLAPPSGIASFLGDTIRTAMYNGVLAVPVYALLRRIMSIVGR